MAKRPLRALFFDIDDTLYSTTEFAAGARRHAIDAMIRAGVRLDADTLLAELDEVVREFGSNNDRQFDKLLQRLPPGVVPAHGRILVVAAGMVAYHQWKFRHFAPHEDAVEVLKTLHERGVALGVITAGIGIKQAEKIVRLDIHTLVAPHLVFITDDAGIAKTNTKLFLRACRAVPAPPPECAYIGDNPPVDVDVPHRLGMRTFLSRRSGKYREVRGDAEADHVIHNFWDLLDIIDREYELLPPREPGSGVIA